MIREQILCLLRCLKSKIGIYFNPSENDGLFVCHPFGAHLILYVFFDVLHPSLFYATPLGLVWYLYVVLDTALRIPILPTPPLQTSPIFDCIRSPMNKAFNGATQRQFNKIPTVGSKKIQNKRKVLNLILICPRFLPTCYPYKCHGRRGKEK